MYFTEKNGQVNIAIVKHQHRTTINTEICENIQKIHLQNVRDGIDVFEEESPKNDKIIQEEALRTTCQKHQKLC